MKKHILILVLMLSSILSSNAQNSPLYIWGGGLNGNLLQTAAIYSESFGLVIEAPKNASDLNLPIKFGWRGGGASAIRILSNGNFGIGTDNPNEKLSVNGNVRAKEVKVEIANWPDYVFAKSYILPSLQTMEQFIKDKGHLPGIPSSAEVEANGIDLGEMNAKLLKKIEELTLHLIEMKKEINEIKTKSN